MAVAPTLVTIGAFTGADEHPTWELVPLLALPEVDLAVSVKSRFIHNRCLLRVIYAATLSPVTFVAYLIAICLIVAVFYLPAPTGRIVAVVAMVLGVPGAVVSVMTLRFEMVMVMLKTLDAWFSIATSTVFAVAMAFLFRDARAVVMVPVWVGFVSSSCVDASNSGLRRLWIANVLSVTNCLAMFSAISTDIPDQLNPFAILRVNGHTVSVMAVVRECLLTMTMVILRNVLRKHTRAPEGQQNTVHSTLFRCTSFRCRLQLRPVVNQSRRDASTDLGRQHEPTATAKAKLRFSPALAVLDAQCSLVPMAWLWRLSIVGLARVCLVLPSIGFVGVVVTNAILLVSIMSPETLDQRRHLPIAIAGVSASIVFIGISIVTGQRELLWAIVTSFDFLFIVLKITNAHVTVACLVQWQPIAVLALMVDWLWWFWILSWDAIPPTARRRLGLTQRLAFRIALLLVSVLALVVVAVLMVDAPNRVGDPVLNRWRLSDHVLEIRAFPWLLSSVTTVTPWTLRIVWRLWFAGETELVVLNGTVVYESQKPTKARQAASRRKQRIAPTNAQAPHADTSASNAVA